MHSGESESLSNGASTRARRGLLVFVALLVLAGLWLLAVGPMPVGAHAHRYADARSWWGVPNAANVLVNVPIFWLSVWGWCATRMGPWPRALRLPWQGFHFWVMAAAVAAAMYHAAPGDALYVASRTCQACAFVLLTLGLLAERVDARWGSARACAGAILLVTLTGLAIARSRPAAAPFDLRPLVMLELLPVLLIPIVALDGANPRTRTRVWLSVLAIYASAKLVELADAAVLHATGWISGHTLMHLGCATVVGLMAYRAATARSGGTASEAADGALSQRQTSLNTTG